MLQRFTLVLTLLGALVVSVPALAATAPPTVTLTSQPSSPTSATTGTITWTSQGASSTTCALDSKPPAFACSSPLTLTGLSTAPHTLAVRVANSAGAAHAIATWTVSPLAAPIAVPSLPSPTRPTVTITSTPAASSNATAAVFMFNAANATTVTCSLDGAAATACSSPVTYSALAVGQHTFAVKASSGAASASDSFAWTVTPPPTVKIQSGPSSTTASTAASFAFSALNATTVTCSLDGAAATPCASPVSYSSLAQGAHALVVKAVAGLLSASDSYAWTVSSGTLANAWVDTNGGTCAGSSTPVAYNDTTACGTFQAAVAALPASGGLVRVRCGTYPAQTLAASGKTGMTTIMSELQKCATVQANGALAVNLGAGAGNVTLDHLTIDGMVYGSHTVGAGNDNVVISNDDVNVGKKVSGPSINFAIGNHISITGNTIGPSCCGYNGGHGASPVGINIGKPTTAVANCTTQVCNLVIDGNTIQGVVRDCALWPSAQFGACPDTNCPNSVGCHIDGIHIWGVDGAIIAHNRLYGVECQGIFIENTNASLQRNVSIVDNAIAALPGGCSNKGIYLSAGGTTDGATNGFAGTWTIAFNSGGGALIGPNGCGSCWPGTTFKIVGNAMSLFSTNVTGNNAGCLAGWGAATVAYSYNVWRPGGTNIACGPTDKVASPSFLSEVTGPTWGDDYHLAAPGPADNYVPASVCLAIVSDDFDGQARGAGGSCDAGADER